MKRRHAARRLTFSVLVACVAMVAGCASSDYGGSVYAGTDYYDSWGYAGPWYGAGPGQPIGPPPRPAHPIAPAPRPAVRR